jgi:hypothetical protein
MTRPTLLAAFALLLPCASAHAQVAGQASVNVVPKNRMEHSAGKESGVKKGDKGPSTFTCPRDTVMTGRRHLGDENEETWYQCASLTLDPSDPSNPAITVEDYVWSDEIEESAGKPFLAPQGRVLVGREHRGDENGETRYQTGIVKVGGQATLVGDPKQSGKLEESSGEWFKAGPNGVLTGRWHDGDENGDTMYYEATLSVAPASFTH